MLDFLLGLELWQLTLVVLGLSLGIGLVISVGIRIVFRLKPTTQQADLAIDLMQVSSTYIGILLAFAGVLAWQDYNDADQAVEREAGVASIVYRDLAIYGPQMAGAREDLKAYVNSIIADEWPLLGEGKRSPATDGKLVRLFDDIGSVKPADQREAAIFNQTLSQLNTLVSLRRDRLAASLEQVPPVLWIVAILGSILTLAYASAFVSSPYASLMISGTSLTIGLLFLFLLGVDYPLRGRLGVSNKPLVELSWIFNQIDGSRSVRSPVG